MVFLEILVSGVCVHYYLLVCWRYVCDIRWMPGIEETTGPLCELHGTGQAV